MHACNYHMPGDMILVVIELNYLMNCESHQVEYSILYWSLAD